MSKDTGGTLYVVATPIGNLDDITLRAVDTLRSVSLIAAEDTRHTGKLLQHLGIQNELLSVHSFNESSRVARIIERLAAGDDVALVSDAGTPLISDPGYHLVREVRGEGFRVSPIPGPSAMAAALSVAGLPSDRFVFEGFLPAKRGARLAKLKEIGEDSGTLIFYESPHRIGDLLEDIMQLYPARQIVLARELTKTFETIRGGTAQEQLEAIQEDANQGRGEFVVLVEGCREYGEKAELDVDSLLTALLSELPVKKVAAIASKVTGVSKNALYQRALDLRE